MTTRILIVDDSRVDRCLIMGLLGNHPEWIVELAEDGRQALDAIHANPPDLIVTDLVMPEMTGLELLCTVKQSHPKIPVILLTAYGNETIAIDALESGAASYVPKARQAERLAETVQRVLERAAVDRCSGRLSRCVIEYHCHLALDNDPSLVRTLVDQTQAIMAGIEFADLGERMRVGEALEEALFNAMYHGNLEIGFRELAEARGELDGRHLGALVEQRRQMSKLRDRKIQVDIVLSPTEARFVVRDEGAGFDVQSVIGGDDTEPFESGKRRGLMLIHTLMDDVTFNEFGNELTMCKRRVTPFAAQEAAKATLS